MKKLLSIFLALVLTLNGNVISIFADSINEDVAMETIQEEQKSERRKNYDILLEGNYKNADLKLKFIELFGNNYSVDDIKNNYTEIFDISESEIDQGIIEVLSYEQESDDEGEKLIQDIPPTPVDNKKNSRSLAEVGESLDNIFIDEEIFNDHSDEQILADVQDTVNENVTNNETEQTLIDVQDTMNENVTDNETEQTLIDVQDTMNENITNDKTEQATNFPSRFGKSATVGSTYVSLTKVSSTMTTITVDLSYSPNSDVNNILTYYNPITKVWTYLLGRDDKPQATSQRYTLNNLVAGTKYRFKIGAYNRSTGTWAEEYVNISTDFPPAKTPSIRVSNVTGTSITYDVVFPYEGEFQNYIYVQTRGSHNLNGSWVYIADTSSNSGKYTLTGLVPESTYEATFNYADKNHVAQREYFTATTAYTSPNYQSYSGNNIAFLFEQAVADKFGSSRLSGMISSADRAYTAMANLVGGELPYSGNKMTIQSDRSLNGTLVEGRSGNPITWQAQEMPKSALRMNAHNANANEVILHEMAHNFDSYKWTFEAEALADFKVYYIADVNNEKFADGLFDTKVFTGTEYKDYLKSYIKRQLGHVSYDASIAKGTYSPSGMAYNLADISQKIGWEPFKKTFRFIGELPYAEVPNTSIGKFNLFITKLSDFSGRDVFAMFNTQEKSVYESKYGGKFQRYVSPRVNATILEGQTLDANLNAGQYMVYAFTPSKTARYNIVSTSTSGTGLTGETSVVLYQNSELTSYWPNPEGTPTFSLYMTAGTTYYIKLSQPNAQVGLKSKITVTNNNNFTSDEILLMAKYYAQSYDDDSYGIKNEMQPLVDSNGDVFAYAVPIIDYTTQIIGHVNVGARKDGLGFYTIDKFPNNYKNISTFIEDGYKIEYDAPFLYYAVPNGKLAKSASSTPDVETKSNDSDETVENNRGHFSLEDSFNQKNVESNLKFIELLKKGEASRNFSKSSTTNKVAMLNSEKNKRYINIVDSYDSSKVYYGGDQGWWLDITPKGQEYTGDKYYMNSKGCGATAFANIIAYNIGKDYNTYKELLNYTDETRKIIKQYENGMSLYVNNVNFIQSNFNKSFTYNNGFTKNEYTKFMDFYSDLALIPSIIGMNGNDMNNAFESLKEFSSFDYIKSTPYVSYSSTVEKFFEDKLNSDIPVLMLNYLEIDDTKYLANDKKQMDALGFKEDSIIDFDTHWMTVTKYFYNGSSGESNIAFSTWGRRISVNTNLLKDRNGSYYSDFYSYELIPK